MRKLFVFIFLCAVSFRVFSYNPMTESPQIQIMWTVMGVDPVGTGLPMPKSDPIQPPYVTQNSNVLTFDANHADYVLTLLDEDGEEVYTTLVPSTTTTVVLPSSLTGLYEIQLYPGGAYYYTGDLIL